MPEKSLPRFCVNFLFILSLLIGLSGCGLITITINTPEPKVTNTINPEPTAQVVQATSAPVTQVTPSAPAQLNPNGPWLIYPTSAGIKAANADGSGSFLVAPTSLKDQSDSEEDIPSGISRMEG